jgi:ribulose-phosphate 3-epimerase
MRHATRAALLNSDMGFIAPAVLPSSRADLEEKLGVLARIPTLSRIQIDIVDGRFAAPASWPYTAPKELRDMVARNEMLPELHRIEYEIDLMCFDAERAMDAWLALGASRFTFHAEGITDLPRFFATIRGRHGSGIVDLGLALNISSNLALIEPYLEQISYVQFMGIATIGRQAQPFDRRVLEKVRLFHKRHPQMPVQVDGGISLRNARELTALSVTNLIVGSAITRAKDPVAAVAALEACQSPFGV